jgi:hypothetical protein
MGNHAFSWVVTPLRGMTSTFEKFSYCGNPPETR